MRKVKGGNIKENQEPVHYHDKPEDVRMQKYIRSRANYSLAILGMAFVKNGSGRFLNLGLDIKTKSDTK